MKAPICKLIMIFTLVIFPVMAQADDRVACVVNIDDSRWFPEEYGKVAQSRCNDGDVIFGVIEQGSKISGALFYAAVVCRMDKQIVIAPSGRDFMCVFRGEGRKVRSLLGSAPEK